MLFQLAKDLRKNMTDAEKMLWIYLKTGIQGYKFRRQHPVGIYVADFYCHKLKLIIELDGSIHDLPETKEKDAQRENDLNAWGYKIVRFTNSDIMRSIASVLQEIKNTVEKESEKIKL